MIDQLIAVKPKDRDWNIDKCNFTQNCNQYTFIRVLQKIYIKTSNHGWFQFRLRQFPALKTFITAKKVLQFLGKLRLINFN